VVVLSWFGKDDTVACVESLLSGSPRPAVLVVDNGSFDGALEAVSERWPEVATLQTGSNLGFAGGMNAGITWALEHDAAFITVINNDTVVSQTALAKLTEVAAQGAAVCPEIFYRDTPDVLWFGGGKLETWAGFPRHLELNELAPPVDGLRPTELLTGCCITASSATWRTGGLFVERFFLNFEDSEWSMRAKHNGVPLFVVPDATILHTVSASFTRSGGSLQTFYYMRNGLLFGRLTGNSLRARCAFVRYQGPHTAAREWREGRRRAALLEGVEVIWAAGAHVVRRYGRAPRALQRLVRARDGRTTASSTRG
jgi:GT2 family glycosyltransferase